MQILSLVGFPALTPTAGANVSSRTHTTVSWQSYHTQNRIWVYSDGAKVSVIEYGPRPESALRAA